MRRKQIVQVQKKDRLLTGQLSKEVRLSTPFIGVFNIVGHIIRATVTAEAREKLGMKRVCGQKNVTITAEEILYSNTFDICERTKILRSKYKLFNPSH